MEACLHVFKANFVKNVCEVAVLLVYANSIPHSLKPAPQKSELVAVVVKASCMLDQKMLLNLFDHCEDVLLNAEHQEVIYVGEKDDHQGVVNVDIRVGLKSCESNKLKNPSEVILP